uniref:Translin-associated protein X n=1 Tax=Petromyzon marinus TaxID=7757 RepID=A0AAJ7WN93_PETMA|nr:translin-associated protein X [Petromyzon marinus]
MGERDVQMRQAGKDELLCVSPLLASFKGFQLELDARHDKYERLVRLSRDVTIESKRTIFLLHRATVSGARLEDLLLESESKLSAVRQKVRSIALELQGENMYQYLRAFTAGLQEYVEAVSFRHFLSTQTLITREEVNQQLVFPGEPSVSLEITLTDYILGVADLTGELMRLCIASVGGGGGGGGGSGGCEPDPDTPFRLCRFLREVYDGFCFLGNLGPYELSRKLHVLRQSLSKCEDACYALRVRGSEVPRHMLADLVSLRGGGGTRGLAEGERDGDAGL